MNRTLRRLIAGLCVSAASTAVCADQGESPFPTSTGLYGAVVSSQPEGGSNYYGRFDWSSGSGGGPRSCAHAEFSMPPLGGIGGGGKEALIVLPIFLAVISIVAVTGAVATAINNEICKHG